MANRKYEELKKIKDGKKGCVLCQQTKPLSKFKKNKDGDHYVRCKECAEKYNQTYNTPRINEKSMSVEMNGHKTEMGFLLNIQRQNTGWKYAQAIHLLNGLKNATENSLEVNLKGIFQKYGSGRSLSACGALVKELKKAANDKLSLEEYWKGRKYRPGAKVLFSGKSK